jgi:protein-S-isoprenylcysteine O-methyltransferase Ste14
MSDYGYGLWTLVVIDSAVFILFAISFFHPRGGRDWRALGGFSAFIVALFAEMYGYPLTIYLAGSVFGDKLGLSHNAGHLWADLVGWNGDPHLSPFHFASWLFIGGGFWLIAGAWNRLRAAARQDRLATDGPYERIRHPQYVGFIAIMVGFLLQWPTLPTLVMFPILVVVYRRLAIREEREVRSLFGDEWDAYADRTPRFIPAFRRARPVISTGPIRGRTRSPRDDPHPNANPNDAHDSHDNPTEHAGRIG